MSLPQEHGPMLKPSPAEGTDAPERLDEVPKNSPDKVQPSPNHHDVSVTEDDRRELPANHNSASPILVKELRNRNIVINQRFRKRKNTKGKQVISVVKFYSESQ